MADKSEKRLWIDLVLKYQASDKKECHKIWADIKNTNKEDLPYVGFSYHSYDSAKNECEVKAMLRLIPAEMQSQFRNSN